MATIKNISSTPTFYFVATTTTGGFFVRLGTYEESRTVGIRVRAYDQAQGQADRLNAQAGLVAPASDLEEEEEED